MTAGPEVQTERDGIRRAWRQSEGEFVLLGFRTGPGVEPTSPELLRTVTEVVAATNREVDERWPLFGSGAEPSASPRGPVIGLTCHDGQALEAWCHLFADGMATRGFSGVLGPLRNERPALKGKPGIRCISAVLSLRGWTMRPDSDRQATRGVWATDATLASELATWATRWTHLDGGDLFVGARHVSMRVSPDAAVGLLTPAFGSSSAQADVGTFVGLDEARRVRFEFAGRLILEIRSAARTWQDVLEEMTSTVTAYAARVDYALVRQATMFALAIDGVTNRPPVRQPHRPGATAPVGNFHSRQLDDSVYVPDANPVQLLTEQHLAGAADLSGWDRVEVAPGRHLVSSRELDGWFGQPEVDPALVERARADFGEIIPLHHLR